MKTLNLLGRELTAKENALVVVQMPDADVIDLLGKGIAEGEHRRCIAFASLVTEKIDDYFGTSPGAVLLLKEPGAFFEYFTDMLNDIGILQHSFSVDESTNTMTLSDLNDRDRAMINRGFHLCRKRHSQQ